MASYGVKLGEITQINVVELVKLNDLCGLVANRHRHKPRAEMFQETLSLRQHSLCGHVATNGFAIRESWKQY